MIRQTWNPFWRFPRASLLLVCLVCLPALLRLQEFRVSSEARVLLEGDQRNLSSYEKVSQILKQTEVLLVSLEVSNVFTVEGLDVIRNVSDALAQLPSVVDVKSLTHSSRPIRRGFGFEMEPLVPERRLDLADLEALRKFSLEHPLVRNLIVAADSRHTIIMVTFGERAATAESQTVFRERIDSTLAPFRQAGFSLTTLALPLVEEEVRSTLRGDVKVIVPAAVLFLLIILIVTFRSWKVVLIVLANQVLVLLTIPGAIDLAGFPLTVFSVILLPLLAGVHLMLLIHVYTATQRSIALGFAGEDTVNDMWNSTFKACAFASLTSMLGLLSLLLSEVRQVRDFGLVGAVGVAWVFVMTFGPGISALLLAAKHGWVNPGRAKANTSSAGGAWAGALIHLVTRRRRLIFGSTVVLLAICAVGLGRVRTDIRAVEFLHPRSATRQAVEALDRIYGGINVVQLELDSGTRDGINQPAFLRYVQEVHRFAETRSDVTGAYSYAQLMAMMNQIWEGGGHGTLELPKNPILTGLFVAALRSQDFPFLTGLADPTFQVAYVVLRSRDMPATRYLTLLEEVVAFAQQHKPPGVKVSAAQGIHSILEADRRIVRSQMDTVGGTLLVIGIVLALLWKSPGLALLSLITNAIPVAVVIGMAGFLGLPLNSITLMVSAVAFGIAVDDSVHLITHWQHERRLGYIGVEAVTRALQAKGRAIVATSVALIAIFAVFVFSSFPPVIHFGFLTAVAFGAALVTVLYFLPAILCSYRWRPRGQGRKATPGAIEPSASV